MLDNHMYMCTSVPSCNVRLLVTVGVRYGSTVVAARARPKAIDVRLTRGGIGHCVYVF